MNKTSDAILSYEALRERLGFFAEDEYRDFTARLLACERPLVGVRIPTVREIAGQIPRELYGEFLREKPVTVEEVLVRGMLISKMPYDEMLEWFNSQVDEIDNWSTCDVFCSGVAKVVKRRRDEFLESRIEGLLDDSREFAVRVGLVMLKCAYMDAQWLAVVFDRVEKLGAREEYYIRMAIAWLVAECFIKYPEATLGYLKVSRLPKWTFNKTISKICDSYRLEPEMKEMLRGMRK